MSDLEELFKRQAEWQQSRAGLSWSEKLRMAEVLRDAAIALRKRNTERDANDAEDEE